MDPARSAGGSSEHDADTWKINYLPMEGGRYSNDETATVKLPASDIAAVNATKSRLMKQAVVTMNNGEEFVFDYGLLSVKNLVAAIESIAGR